jgi:carboxylesterase type B
VVTFNYRLGALGFLSTLDSNSPGNYGLMDIIKVLKFIQKYITIFGGNPDKVTVAGAGSGAAAIGILLVSPKSRDEVSGNPLFHQAILMSGSDLCEWSTIGSIWNANALTYARDLSRLVGCGFEYDQTNSYLVDCLSKKHYEEIVNATASISKRYGSLAGPFAPVVDGPGGILPDSPQNLRSQNKTMKVKIIAGLTLDEGAYYARNLTKDLVGVDMVKGLDPATFRELITQMVQQRAAIQNVYEVVGAIEFEYTYWAKPDNESAVRQNLIDLWSDFVYGSCVDAFLKAQTGNCEPGPNCPAAYMYLFTHRSEYEPLPFWMGIPHGRDVDYLIGYPFYNDTLGNITGIVPEQTEWTYVDRNISDFVQDMFLNFTKYSNPTPDWARNISWFQYYKYNLSYLHIAEFSYMDVNYRQNHYAFWRDYFPTVSVRRPITTTPEPTPRPRVEYQIATWSLVGASFITFIVLVALAITLWLRTRAM